MTSKFRIPSVVELTGKPFEGDLFQRELLAKKLMAHIGNIEGSAVIAIDASWGEGKTYFGKNFHAYLNNHSDYQSIFIDAFENDYVEDPFLLIVSELLKITRPNKKFSSDLLKASKSVAVSLIPLGGKLAINVAGAMLLNEKSMADKIGKIPELLGDASQRILEDKIKRRESEQVGILKFKETLEAYTRKLKKPLIVFIDELDRCKPDFSIAFLERIKHLFDIERMVFVLMINKTQLERAINGIYGPIDAHGYLSKFIHFYVSLPKIASLKNETLDANSIYVSHLRDRFPIGEDNAAENFVAALKFIAHLFNMSLRDIERAFVIYSMTTKTRELGTPLTFLICLKLKHNDIYTRLTRNPSEAFDELNKMLTSIYRAASEIGASTEFEVVRELLAIFANQRRPTDVSEQTQAYLAHYGWLRNPRSLIGEVIADIDVNVTV